MFPALHPLYNLEKDGSGVLQVVVGYNTESGSEDWLVVKYNPDGDSEWVRIFDYAGGSDQATSVRVDSLGNIYVAGYIDNISNVDYFLVWCL